MSCKTTETAHIHQLATAVRPLLNNLVYEPEPDLRRICMLACLDFQMRWSMVEKALNHFYQEAAPHLGIADLGSLRAFLERTPSDEEAAIALWGARFWTRAALLRQLVAFFLAEQAKQGGSELAAARAWGQAADFKRDFQGKIKGLGYNTFVRMAQQLGANTAAPTGWTCHYVEEVIGRMPKDNCLVDVLNATADELGQNRADLDWAIRRHRGHP